LSFSHFFIAASPEDTRLIEQLSPCPAMRGFRVRNLRLADILEPDDAIVSPSDDDGEIAGARSRDDHERRRQQELQYQPCTRPYRLRALAVFVAILERMPALRHLKLEVDSYDNDEIAMGVRMGDLAVALPSLQ
jgi:hypothetical protein